MPYRIEAHNARLCTCNFDHVRLGLNGRVWANDAFESITSFKLSSNGFQEKLRTEILL
jgi:hypothetical protein